MIDSESPIVKNILVISHYEKGGGTPFDSIWFSREECAREGIQVKTVWNKRFLKSVAAILGAERVLFDGMGSLKINSGMWLVLLVLLLNKPTAIYWHETDWYFNKWPFNLNTKPKYSPIHLFLRYWLKLYPIHWLLKDPRTVHFHVSQYGVNMMSQKYGYDQNKIFLLNNITRDQPLLNFELPMRPIPYLVVACGKVSTRKRPDLFIEVAKKVIADNHQAQFLFLGRFVEGQYSPTSIKQLLDQNGLTADKVRFIGEVSDPYTYMAEANVFLHTAEDDPMPKVLMEALGLGKYCVAFSVGGIPEIIGSYGTVVPFGQVENLAKAVSEGFQKTNEKQQLQRRQYYLEKFSPNAFAKNFRNVLNRWYSLS